MARMAHYPRYISLVGVLVLATALPGVASAQVTGDAPGVPGKPVFVNDVPTNTISNDSPRNLPDRTPWFDGGEEWTSVSPSVLPGREAAGDDNPFMLWSGAKKLASCLVKAEYLAPTETSGRDSRVSVLVACTLPRDERQKATGYEVAVEASGLLRILKLEADRQSSVLAESTGTPTPLEAGRPYVITVGRVASSLMAKVQVKDGADPGWQVWANDATYPQGNVGAAAMGARGRIIDIVVTDVEPEPAPVPAAEAGPGVPGKPMN